ncbi:hypothetical protein FRX31_027069 [Thalictrum thalictroides]|uniref:Uncharacterized protein n=1 Tax=Thalictrum thalictroides TaxID=46969 RepID=A0A7J6VE24_THATH|nr:hypothetical protein FRX31_027069 [Thalictrum thalictroides]
MINCMKAARSEPMELSHRILPRVMPFLHDNVQKYGKMHFTWFGPNPRKDNQPCLPSREAKDDATRLSY